jgi:hypothetical protein
VGGGLEKTETKRRRKNKKKKVEQDKVRVTVVGLPSPSSTSVTKPDLFPQAKTTSNFYVGDERCAFWSTAS